MARDQNHATLITLIYRKTHSSLSILVLDKGLLLIIPDIIQNDQKLLLGYTNDQLIPEHLQVILSKGTTMSQLQHAYDNPSFIKVASWQGKPHFKSKS